MLGWCQYQGMAIALLAPSKALNLATAGELLLHGAMFIEVDCIITVIFEQRQDDKLNCLFLPLNIRSIL